MKLQHLEKHHIRYALRQHAEQYLQVIPRLIYRLRVKGLPISKPLQELKKPPEFEPKAKDNDRSRAVNLMQSFKHR